MFHSAAAWRRYKVAILAVIVALVVRLALVPWLGMDSAPFLTFWFAVGVAAAHGGFLSGMLAGVLSAAVASSLFFPNSVFVEPTRFEIVRAVGFLVFSAAVSWLTDAVLRGKRAGKEHKEWNRLILDTALDAVITIDTQGRITDWNPQAAQTFGWPREEILGLSLRDTVIPHRFRDAHDRGLRRYLETGNPSVMGKRVEMSALHRDGREFPVELAITPLRRANEVVFSAFVRDITRRKAWETRLQTQLARLELLSGTTRAIGERQDLRSILQVVVQSLEEDLSCDFACVCLCDPTRQSLTVASVGSKSLPLAQELGLVPLSRVVVESNGLSRCVQGQLVYEPDTAAVPFPFPQRLFKAGLRALVCAPLAIESNVFGVLVTARRTASSFDSTDCEFLRQLSEHVGLAAHNAELYNALQQAYEDLRGTQQLAMQQERLRALGEMASGIAHDINNAMSPLAAYTVLLTREPNLSEKAVKYLGIMEQAVGDVTSTIRRLNDFARRREPGMAPVPVQLNRIVEQVVELTRARWSDMPQQKGIVIRVRTDLAAGIPEIGGVESEIREALMNLVFNAVDAMPDGGDLVLRTVLVEDSARHIRLEVADTGVGMDEEVSRRCLEPFYTTKGERGTGLGLAMVYGILKRHGAEIEIDSKPGRGTTVRLRFPVLAPVAQPAPAQAAVAAPPKLRILIVDDDPLVIRALTDMLEAEGHSVASASGGQDGIDAFEHALAGPDRFHLVVTDLGMPHVNGNKVAAAVKAAHPATPVMLLTGWGHRILAEREQTPGVDRVLSKPVKLLELRSTIAELTAAPRGMQPSSPGSLS